MNRPLRNRIAMLLAIGPKNVALPPSYSMNGSPSCSIPNWLDSRSARRLQQAAPNGIPG
jgi:hypothetical protein